ncbi:MAG: lytic transglycosylase domain-containing protein [Campylobacterales bacterium]|nr:lytic transglycosylase domain-containing protein [Campylobacterales bacterium]
MARIVFLITLISLSLYGTSRFEPIFEKAGHDFGIEPSLLARIATIESSMNPRAINQNTNGTVDIGLMQINSMHLKRLSAIGVTKQALLDPEVNIYVGALLLSSHIRKRGYNLSAIGCYHSANPVFKNQWLKRLAMVEIVHGEDERPTSKNNSSAQMVDDPRSRFVQGQLAQRTDEKIAQGMSPKKAWREAKAEVDRLMGYTG